MSKTTFKNNQLRNQVENADILYSIRTYNRSKSRESHILPEVYIEKGTITHEKKVKMSPKDREILKEAKSLHKAYLRSIA